MAWKLTDPKDNTIVYTKGTLLYTKVTVNIVPFVLILVISMYRYQNNSYLIQVATHI